MPLVARSEQAESAATPPTVERPATEDMARWLDALVAPEGCVELRAIGVTRKGQPGAHAESTFFAPGEMADMARAARGLSGRAEGVYWTLNPVHANLYLAPVGQGATAGDILARRWLLVDCDPARPADVSASEAEKAASLEAARAIRDFLRSEAWPEPVLADSGNGYHLLYRVDLPNDDPSKALVRSCLKALAARFDSPAVKVDTAVHDAPRICKLYGTLARKGEHSTDRPHRYSRVLDLPASPLVVAIEWLEALARPVETAPEAATIPIRAGLVARAPKGVDPVRAYALAAMNAEVDRVVRAPPGARNTTLNEAAFALGQLVGSGAISEGEAVVALTTAGLMAGPNEAKIRDTVTRGLAAGKAKPRDLAGVGLGRGGGGAAMMPPGGPDADGPVEEDDDPHRLARVFVDRECAHPDGPTLRFWLERWHRWDGAAWRTTVDAEVAGELTAAIKREFDRIARERGKATKAVTTKVVGNTLQALRSVLLLKARACPRQPAWLDVVGPNPLECLAAPNGIVHLPTLVAGGPVPIPPTPRFFSPNALDYDFAADAPEPRGWLEFLGSLWDDDPESIACLQEWFGYLITPDTRQQKMLFVIGPRRSGKGTILRVLRALVGASNVAAPTLSGLATNFGAAPLIGKSLAIVPDARLSARADAQVIIERLLSITGEDPQTIDRKHREDWTGDLLTRFAIASNELPRMGDASSALPGRVVLLRLTRTFFGREDTSLFDRLVVELPGICLWAIRGWESLRLRGRFHQPRSGQELLDELDELSSPVNAFVAERCVQGSECRVPVKDLYAAWKSWCEGRGKDHPGDEQGFGRNLRAVLPQLALKRAGSDGTRQRVYLGLALKEVSEPAF